MLKILLGTSWRNCTDTLMEMVRADVSAQKGNRVLIVPESISHETERRLCQYCGDTVSRFAEVLSFTRLSDRVRTALGCGAFQCMDEGGRVVAMAAAAVQLHSRLKAYAAVETKPEFLLGLIEALDECKRCCIRPEDLRAAAQNTEGSLAQKLEELALLFDTYDSICQQGSRDPSDQLTWLLEQLEGSTYAQEHIFYLDGFTDFTGQQMAIVSYLLSAAETVVISLNCDRPGSSSPAFQKAGETANQLIRAAKESGIGVQIINVSEQKDWSNTVCTSLFHGNIVYQPEIAQHLKVMQCDALADECESAADRILELVRSGKRYRDIRVVCTDMATYRSAINLAFSRRNIPMYLSGTEDILDMPIINTVLTALDVACGGFEQQNVIRYLRSALSPIDLNTVDLLENYAVIWNVTGNRWLKAWVNHPDGLGEKMDEGAQHRLDLLNQARETALSPLIRLSKAFSSAATLKDQIVALYTFLNDISLASRLEQLAEQILRNSESAEVQILNQLWEILLSALEQLYDVLGNSAWNSDVFVRLLKLLLSQYDVGTIPSVLDAVTVGAVSGSRHQAEKYLFILGALEGNLPSYGRPSGVLTDQERAALRHLGVPLNGGALDSLQSEFADIYSVFAGAQECIYLSSPSAQTSFVYRRLAEMVGEEQRQGSRFGAVTANPVETAALLARYGKQDTSETLGIQEIYNRYVQCAGHTMGSVSLANTQLLYGRELNLSASQIEKMADCRLAYFLKYGMRAKERKEATVDPAEFGTYVHAVLENTARRIKELGGFRNVDLEQTLRIANEYSKAYAEVRFQQLDSQRITYLFNRNVQELQVIVTELWEELQNSDFEPFDFELSFGGDGDLPAIKLPGTLLSAHLRGFVDRVDVWNNGKQQYFRVVDYKTGKKDFDYCDVFNGLGLQMLLYMFALEDNGSAVLGENACSAGVQYFPARSPLITVDGTMSEEEVRLERQKQWKRKGLILKDDDVLQAMENTEQPVRMGYTRKKDGTISGDLADRNQMNLLKGYIFALLGKLVDDVASGCVEANPYTRGNSHNACAFCPYSAVCHPNFVEGRRNYKAMTAQRFWEEVGKEMEANG